MQEDDAVQLATLLIPRCAVSICGMNRVTGLDLRYRQKVGNQSEDLSFCLDSVVEARRVDESHHLPVQQEG